VEPAQVADRIEINDVITAYTRAVDTADWESLREVFTADAVIDYSSAGGPIGSLDEVIPFIKNMEGFERWQHVIGQIAVAFDGDHAQATAYFINPMVAKAPDGSEVVWEVGGYYHHDLVRTPSGWRSAKMVDELVWSR
jgi:hypothetical protein